MFKVYINTSSFGRGLQIYFVETTFDKTYMIKPLTWERQEVGGGFDSPPTIQLDTLKGAEFLKAMAEALDAQGVKTENGHKIQGLLEATKKHLEDMRRLVFKK